MDKRPRFFIVAGPNGAGKSTLGHAFVPSGVSIFNGDLVFEELIKLHPNLPPERLKGGVAVALERARDRAIQEGRDFAFETNFSSNLTVELIHTFRNSQYNIHLLYFGLPDLNMSESRVTTRVSLGGHDIPSQIIQFNFREGIKMINQNLSLFDSITFISTATIPKIIANFEKKGQNLIIQDTSIAWFNDQFKVKYRGNSKNTNRTTNNSKKKREETIATSCSNPYSLLKIFALELTLRMHGKINIFMMSKTHVLQYQIWPR